MPSVAKSASGGKKLIWVLIVGLVIGLVGCGQTPELKTEETVTKQQAIEIAVKTLQAEGWHPVVQNNYNMTVKERGSEWLVCFEMKPPRPPGFDCGVYISKKDGSVIRIMYGE